MKKPDIHRLLEFQRLLYTLRGIKRSISFPPRLDDFENDAEHSYSLAMNAWFLAGHFPKLNRDICVRIALAHELVEIYAGDTYAYSDQATIDQKKVREEAAVEKLWADWPDFPELIEAIEDYEERNTEEAKFVYALDKLLPALLNYLNEGRVA